MEHEVSSRMSPRNPVRVSDRERERERMRLKETVRVTLFFTGPHSYPLTFAQPLEIYLAIAKMLPVALKDA